MPEPELERRRRSLWKSDFDGVSFMRYNSRNLISRDKPDVRMNYVGLSGKISIEELLAYVGSSLPDIPLDTIMLNFATMTWVDAATPEEIERTSWDRAQQEERYVAYRRKMFEQGRGEFESPLPKGTRVRALEPRNEAWDPRYTATVISEEPYEDGSVDIKWDHGPTNYGVRRQALYVVEE